MTRCSPASAGQDRRARSGSAAASRAGSSTAGASSGPVSATCTRTPVGRSWWAWRTPGMSGRSGAIAPICHPAPPHEASIDHGNHRPGRLLPGGAAAGQGLRGPRHGPPRVDGEVRAHRAPARPDHAPPGRSARPPQPRRRAARLQPGRGLQPRRDVVRRRLVDPADADGRVHRRRRHAPAGGGARGLPRDALLPGVLERDVRQGARDAADRGDAVLPALALRRREGLRPPHHGQLPRVLRPLRLLGDPLQPRVPAPRPRVRDAQDHLARRGDQARPARRSCASATSTPSATGATPRTTSRRCG